MFMPSTPPYSLEFRREAVRLLQDERPVDPAARGRAGVLAAVAAQLGAPAGCR